LLQSLFIGIVFLESDILVLNIEHFKKQCICSTSLVFFIHLPDIKTVYTLIKKNMNYTDRIFPTNKGLTTYLDELIAKNYQIPTFQRDVVWEQENVKKLWDSIYKFYPLGSILIWKTDLKLQNHRQIGGHQITDTNFSRTEYQYILDGQQRTTSLLTSLYGGTIENRPNFNPLLYVDLTIPPDNEIDDESSRNRFLFYLRMILYCVQIKPFHYMPM